MCTLGLNVNDSILCLGLGGPRLPLDRLLGCTAQQSVGQPEACCQRALPPAPAGMQYQQYVYEPMWDNAALKSSQQADKVMLPMTRKFLKVKTSVRLQLKALFEAPCHWHCRTHQIYAESGLPRNTFPS